MSKRLSCFPFVSVLIHISVYSEVEFLEYQMMKGHLVPCRLWGCCGSGGRCHGDRRQSYARADGEERRADGGEREKCKVHSPA